MGEDDKAGPARQPPRRHRPRRPCSLRQSPREDSPHGRRGARPGQAQGWSLSAGAEDRSVVVERTFLPPHQRIRPPSYSTQDSAQAQAHASARSPHAAHGARPSRIVFPVPSTPRAAAARGDSTPSTLRPACRRPSLCVPSAQSSTATSSAPAAQPDASAASAHHEHPSFPVSTASRSSSPHAGPCAAHGPASAQACGEAVGGQRGLPLRRPGLSHGCPSLEGRASNELDVVVTPFVPSPGIAGRASGCACLAAFLRCEHARARLFGRHAPLAWPAWNPPAFLARSWLTPFVRSPPVHLARVTHACLD